MIVRNVLIGLVADNTLRRNHEMHPTPEMLALLRFGSSRFPADPDRVRLVVRRDAGTLTKLDLECWATLPRRSQVSDFHCVRGTLLTPDQSDGEREEQAPRLEPILAVVAARDHDERLP